MDRRKTDRHGDTSDGDQPTKNILQVLVTAFFVNSGTVSVAQCYKFQYTM